MIKPQAILAASATLFILFSPNIFADNYKMCRYTHEEYRIVNGVKTFDYAGSVPLSTYSTRVVGIYDECPVILPANHEWTNFEEIESDNDITHLDSHTINNENCEVHFKSLIHRDDFSIN